MVIIGYHTCQRTSDDDWKEIQLSGPFFSEHDEEDPSRHKFLGSGYYFWDNNISVAHNWGQRRYRGKYYIFESKLMLTSTIFLDLVGNRKDMIWLKSMFEELSPTLSEEDRTVGGLIQVLKQLNTKTPGIFPYKAIRAVEASFTSKEIDRIKFTSTNEAYMNFNPVYVVCLVELDRSIFTSFEKIRSK